MTGKKPTVGVLDDEPKMRSALARLLRSHGMTVSLFETGQQFLSEAAGRAPDCILLDLHMPGITGFDVLEALSSLEIKVPAIVITGHDEPGNAARVHELGAAEYLLKPLDESTLVEAIERVCSSPPQPPE